MKLLFENWRQYLNEEIDHYKEDLDIDDEGNVKLYHIGAEDLTVLDPKMAETGRRNYSKSEFREWDRPRVFFFTKMGQEDAAVGQVQGIPYITKVKFSKLYPVYKDPLKLSYPEMKEKFREITGLPEQHPKENNVFERVATLAEELYEYEGFIYPQRDDNMIVTMWKETPVDRIDQFYGG